MKGQLDGNYWGMTQLSKASPGRSTALLWTAERKVKTLKDDFGGGERLQQSNFNTTLKQGGGSTMVWGCFATSEPG